MMKYNIHRVLIGITSFLFLSDLFGQRDVLTQVSTIDALLNGLYDGETTVKELGEWGDFGIGTFDALDGEMVAVDGQFYQVTSRGTVEIPSPEIKTPFAAVTFFESDNKHPLQPGIDLQAFQGVMDDLIPTQNIFYAIRIEGSFQIVQTRSVPRQIKPYKPLSEITSSQPIFNLENVKGTIVGFRSPSYVNGINVPGYHLHFLTEDKKAGGHVLNFTLQEGVLQIDETRAFLMILPDDQNFDRLDLTVDRESELKQVEQATSDEENEEDR